MKQELSSQRVAFYTLGCKVNQYDTEAVAELFAREGWQIVEFSEPADVYIINTCTVTNMGDRKSRQIIRRAVRQNPEAAVVVMGCYAQVAPGEVAEIEGVDLVVGTNERGRLVDLVREFTTSGKRQFVVNDIFQTIEFEDLPITQFKGRTRATIKIQEGCNEFCSYCKIPYARGRSRSRPLESVVAEVKRLEAAGFSEVVLTGIHLGAYGRDLDGKLELADVLSAVAQSTEIPRIRISSIDPHEVTPRFIQVMEEHPNICRHLHIPLQGGHDEILRAMRRRYTLAEYQRTVEQLREVFPEIALTTDIIVGFPGETEDQCASSLQFVEAMGFSRLHVFRYSRRSGTPAAKLANQVSVAEKQERSQRMLELGQRLALRYHEGFLQRSLPVLFEEPASEETVAVAVGSTPTLAPDEQLWEGLTDNYIRVLAPAAGDVSGRILPVRLQGASEDLMVGQIEKNSQ